MTPSSTGEYTAPHSARSTAASSNKHGIAPPPSAFAWQSWPLIDEWRRCGPVVALTAVISLAIGLALGSLELALLTFAVQAFVLWRLWLPIRYEINAQGIEQRLLGRTRLVPWAAICRCELRPDGLLLYCDADPRPFDSWRSIYVPWNHHWAAVTAALKTQSSPSEAPSPTHSTASR